MTVIPTEAQPSGGIRLQSKSTFHRKSDVSTQFTPSSSSGQTLSEVEWARHDKHATNNRNWYYKIVT